MYQTELWKYSTKKHCQDMLLSFQLLGEDWPDQKVIACLYGVSNHTERHYHTAMIPKSDGTKRQLLVPDDLLKMIQRNIARNVLSGFELSSCASAYCKGTSVLKNASIHTGKRLVLKLDIEDFFGSITFPMVLNGAFSSKYFPPTVGTLLTALCCYHDYLPQGAPSSPVISNLVMKPFDDYMKVWCEEKNISYTRYCDDMTFSGDFQPGHVINKVSGFLDAMGFALNREKTKILSSGRRQTVTGIVVNERPHVSPDYRRRLRQEVYYCLKYGVKSHITMTGREEPKPEIERHYLFSLLGKINYLLFINPQDLWFKQAEGKIRSILDH
ncbi:reverse transcriptase family protein [Lacrimispora algidixylanolytica]|uniref:RNA-directed DNA polymerase n=1 Tax=Lacrimispora algidixylanolytica TaxID=94868 RepID=A0A419SW41_9FIRM|nr:reverse transcriptase family protein [Lacrimispora algidixylanolytica]RKD29431.1 RNA-dependent DNA polymerase [Lacrimispora algidixylanolytica]